MAVGALALVAPLRDQAYCRRILRGRDRLYLLAGFEVIFCHVATVMAEGLSNEPPPPSAV